MALPSSLYFQRAQRLPLRDGAVRAAMLHDLSSEPTPVAGTPATAPAPAQYDDGPPILGLPPGAQVTYLPDAAAAAALTQTPEAQIGSFPTVRYRKAGG